MKHRWVTDLIGLSLAPLGGEKIPRIETSRIEPLNLERLLTCPSGTLSSNLNGGEGRGEEVSRFMGRVAVGLVWRSISTSSVFNPSLICS